MTENSVKRWSTLKCVQSACEPLEGHDLNPLIFSNTMSYQILEKDTIIFNACKTILQLGMSLQDMLTLEQIGKVE